MSLPQKSLPTELWSSPLSIHQTACFYYLKTLTFLLLSYKQCMPWGQGMYFAHYCITEPHNKYLFMRAIKYSIINIKKIMWQSVRGKVYRIACLCLSLGENKISMYMLTSIYAWIYVMYIQWVRIEVRNMKIVLLGWWLYKWFSHKISFNILRTSNSFKVTSELKK